MTRRGFTLTEVLVAMALMLTLVGAMYGFLYDLISVRARVLDLTARRRAADATLEVLEARLACTMVADPTAGAGISGDATGLTVLSRGVTARLAAESRIETDAESGPDEDEPPLLADLQSLELRFDGGRLRARLDDDPHDLGPIAELRLRYYDGSAWSSEYDSRSAGALPVAVEVAVWLERPPDPDDDDAQPDRTRRIPVADAREPSP